MMKREVIKLTDEAIYPELIKLLSENGDVWGDMLIEYKHNFKILFRNGGWTRAYPQYKADYTITDVQFLQKYGENTEPEPDKERELLLGYEKYKMSSGDFSHVIDNFLTSLRKPAFELITADGAKVTDPEQIVWWISSSVSKGKASDMKNWGYRCWASEQAALNHRLHNTPAIKLSDMDWNAGYYQIAVDKAHNLVNERIK